MEEKCNSTKTTQEKHHTNEQNEVTPKSHQSKVFCETQVKKERVFFDWQLCNSNKSRAITAFSALAHGSKQLI